MAAVPLPAGEVEAGLAKWPGVEVAAVNGPASTVVSGDRRAVAGYVAVCQAEGVQARLIPVDYASHSRHVEDLKGELERVLSGIRPRSPRVPVCSTVAGEQPGEPVFDAGYWFRNLRNRVEFSAVVGGLLEEGHRRFIEVSAHPVLVHAIEQTAEAADRSVHATGTLRRQDDSPHRLLTSTAEAWAHGATLTWDPALPPGHLTTLPTYPFNHHHYWLDTTPTTPATTTQSPTDAQNPADALPYKVSWKRLRDQDSLTARLDGRWLLVVPEASADPSVAEGVARELTARGATVESLTVEPGADRSRLRGLLVDATERDEAGPLRGIVSLLALAGDHAGADGARPVVPAGLAASLALIQAAGDAGTEAGLWAVTRGAVAAVPGDVPAPSQALLWGFGRVAGIELPHCWGGLLDLPTGPGDSGFRQLAATLAGRPAEDQVALRASGAYGRRLVRASAAGGADGWRPRGTVLVVGDTAEVAGPLVRWLLGNGARRVTLSGLSGPLPEELADVAARVTVAPCDPADRPALRTLLAEQAPTAVLVAPPAVPPTPLAEMTAEALAIALSAKTGLVDRLDSLLDEPDPLLEDGELDAFVVFSSVAGVWGGAGQGGYAAGTAYLDALAECRRAGGLPVTSVAWTPWLGTPAADSLGEQMSRAGITPLDPAASLDALARAVGRRAGCVTVADIDWERFASAYTATRPTPMFDEVPEVRRIQAAWAEAEADAARSGAGGDSQLLRSLRGRPEEAQLAELLRLVRTHAAAVLGLGSPGAVEARRSFKDLGFNSVTAVELRNRLKEATGLRLEVSLVFDHPDPASLARHLLDLALGQEPEETPRAFALEPAPNGEPIAIVSMACRMPGGVSTPEELWRLLRDGKDAIGPFPANRGWDLENLYDPDPDADGRTYVREGGFLHEAPDFDPSFFGISPREALAMDPQQRLLLETSWEALERAGIDPARLRGSRTGVFVGTNGQHYMPLLQNGGDSFDGYLGTGNSASVMSGRLSYVFGLEGPAVTVDTACSASLVALHLAVQAMRRGECDMALVGGATVMSTPEMLVEFSRQRVISANGRSRAFAAGADGVALGEGVGVLLVERLSDAERNGHPVLAVVRGSAVNQDGASNGLTAPNGPSQQRVIRQALADAGLRPEDIDAVEAHGTGTELGDPIEAEALLATYGRTRTADRPLWLGSLKSNIGHTQAAAGVAGVIKMVLALGNETLPRTLHVDEPTPRVDWSSGAVSLLTEPVDWPAGPSAPRRAAVSSFGISGTNAHTILEQAPVPAESRPGTEPADGTGAWENVTVPLLLSGHTEAALREQSTRLLNDLLEHPDEHPADVGYTLITGRAHFGHRAAVIGESREELLDALKALAEGREHHTVVRGDGTAHPDRRVVFVFPGQGSQWPSMARDLLDRAPAFRETAKACDAALSVHLDWSVLDVLQEKPDAPPLSRVDVVQPVLFTMMLSLAACWRDLGVHPAAVVGHSQGEIAAACVAGALSLEDAARIVALRSRAWLTLAGKGGMAAVSLPEARLRERIERFGQRLSVAAVNSPGTAAVAGDVDALRELLAELTAEGIRAKPIPGVDTAGHSAQVDGLKEHLFEVLAPVSPRSSDIPFYSTVTGAPLDTERLDAGYWYRNMREPVEFEKAVRALIADGYDLFLECNPHPMLAMSLDETLTDSGGHGTVMHTLRRQKGSAKDFGMALCLAYVNGLEIDGEALFGPDSRRVNPPTYPFQRERYWYHPTSGRRGDITAAGVAEAEHPLLGAGVELPETGGTVYTARFGPDSRPWLADHALLGTVLLPGTAILDLVLWAGERSGCGRVGELALQAPLVLPDSGDVELRLLVGGPDEEKRRTVTVHARPAAAGAEAPWTRHAEAVVLPATGEEPTPAPRPVPEPAGTTDPAAFYAEFAERGYDYGPAFQGFTAGARHGEDVVAEVALPSGLVADARHHRLHPALLDAALQAMILGTFFADDGRARMPFAVRGVRLHTAGADRLRVLISPAGDETVRLLCTDLATGAPVLEIDELVVRPVSGEQLAAGAPGRNGGELYRVDWTVLPEPAEVPAPRWALLGEDHAGLADVLGGTGGGCERYDTLTGLLEATTRSAGGILPDIVALSLPTAPEPGPQAVREVLSQALDAAQAWLAAGAETASARLVFVTGGAVATTADETVRDTAAAAVWGLVRSAQSEEPDRMVLLDLDGERPTARTLAAALASGEPQLAVRGSTVAAPRLAPAGPGPEDLVPPAGTTAWRLTPGGGTLEELSLAPAPDAEEPLAPGQVRIAVRAAGVNFRDALIALGMYPGKGTMGAEGAGVVVETAPDVTGLSAGDRVLGMWNGGFGPLVVADHRMVAPIPHGWSYAEAASVPAVFLTSYYALTRLARARTGQTVLVHAAAGGVGMATLQLARHLGLEVYATASTGKWDALQKHGIPDDRIADSRTLDFAERFLSRTGGRGVDIVLNSLAGEFVDASLRLLPRGGHFLELGKADVRDPRRIAAAHPGTDYRAFDLVQAGPDTVGEMLGELLELFAAGALRPLPLTAYGIRDARTALRTLSQARHTGKLVLTVPAGFDTHRTVLLTGGTGTLGQTLARHLVNRHGVRHLLLAGRTGAAAEGVAELIGELGELGAEVRVAACDAADRQRLTELLAGIPVEHPLGAVVHAAGTLDDGTIPSLTGENIDNVLRPKADAVLNLHELTRDADLSAFVLYSSSSALLGSPGQGAYAAANAFLDGFARYRKGLGLPALSLAWGLWGSNSRMAGHLDQSGMQRRLNRSGIMALTDAEGLALFDAAQDGGDALLVPMRLNRTALRASGRITPFLSGLAGGGPAAGERRPEVAAVSGTLAERLTGLTAQEGHALVLAEIRAHAAAVLGHGSDDSIPEDRAFKDLGFDSLTAVEMRNRLSAATGLRLPATLVFDHPTPGELAGHLSAELSADDAPGSASPLTELDRFEALFTALAPGTTKDTPGGAGALMIDEAERQEIAGRLAALAGLWNRLHGTTTAPEDGDTVADALEAADDHEIFAFLDERF
ncbi:SDR family NAD(P)-dependent oxidoreductase [Streptomyces xinghaiensis]